MLPAAIGTVAGLAVQGISDLSDGHLSSGAAYTGAGVGGAVGGVSFVLTAGNPLAAGAASGFTSTLVQRSIETKGRLTADDGFEIVKNTAIGATLGKISKFVSASGPGAMASNWIARNEKMTNMLMGKLSKGQISQMTAKTFAKMSTAVTTAASPATVAAHQVERMISCAKEKADGRCGP